MISIIISTYKPDNFNAIKSNIADTIGVPFEIIEVQNHNQYSLCEAYNLGQSKAIYPYLCFVHDDILFQTTNWGSYLLDTMKNNKQIGLIGLAGTKFKSTYPYSSWGQSSYLSVYKRGKIMTTNTNEEYVLQEYDCSTHKEALEEVVCLDGIFLFTKQEVFTICKFDDLTFKNFHGYDLDFSLQVHNSNKYKVFLTREIEVVHFSKGNYNKHFNVANKAIQNKWKSKLPTCSSDLNMSKFKIYYLNQINNVVSLANSLGAKVKRAKVK